MPYDALTAATEELAPAQATTNFFDPAAGASVISRYAGARIASEGAAALGEAASRLGASRIDRANARRQAMLFDRDEREYQEKTDYKAQRGQFLDSVSSIDPNADDYDEQISSVLRDLPMEVREDDALQALLAHKNRIADSVRTEKEMQLRRQEQFDDRKNLMEFKMRNDPRLASLTEEDYQKAYNPETGEHDPIILGQLAYQRGRGDKMEDSKEMIAERDRVAREAKAADLTRRRPVAEAWVKNQEAFPSQVHLFQKAKMAEAKAEGKTAYADTIEEDFPAEMSAAMAYENDKLNSEIGSALARDNVEDYVNLVPNATKEQKELRRKLWKHAWAMDGNAAPETGAAPTPAPAKTLDRETGMKFLQEAGGDKAKARELARAAGYVF